MLLTKNKKIQLFLYIGLISVVVVSCKVLLAPEYDKEIVESASSASENTMILLAKVSEGTSKSNFSERENEYNDLIGVFDALSIKAKARPLPKNSATKKINELLNTRGNSISGDYPSAFAFEEISKTLKKMKETDKNSGLKPILVEAFKGQIEIFLDQALTYESFLKR